MFKKALTKIRSNFHSMRRIFMHHAIALRINLAQRIAIKYICHSKKLWLASPPVAYDVADPERIDDSHKRR